MRDLAAALEAVLILDDRLTEVGSWPSTTPSSLSLGLDSKRMLLGHVARVATWSATSDSPDQAFPRLHSERVARGPVVLVTAPQGSCRGPTSARDLLRPVHASDAFYTGDPEITADTARMLVANQLFLTGLVRPTRREVAGAINLRATLRGPPRDPRGDHAPPAPPHRPPTRRGPGSTLVAADRDHHRHPTLASKSSRVRADPGRAARPGQRHPRSHPQPRHHPATRTAAREHQPAHRRPTQAIGPTRVVRGTRLGASLTDLAHQPAPTRPVARLSNPHQRTAFDEPLKSPQRKHGTPAVLATSTRARSWSATR